MSLRYPRVTRFNRMAFALGTVAVVAVGAFIAFVIESTGLLERIETLTVENPTDFLFNPAPLTSTSWHGVGVVGAGTNKEFTGVIDQGASWVFRLVSRRATPTEKEFSLEEMTAGGWRSVVPRSVYDVLRAIGVEPPP